MSDQQVLDAALYLVPTPIGNREDITLRALRVLKSVDAVACEDTRTSGQLLQYYGIAAPQLIAVHGHNELQVCERIAERIAGGERVAYCSEAGTPGISDPGFVLVRECLRRGVRVVSLPGASAALTALTASGLPTDHFVFFGFAPHKKGRKTFFDQVVQQEYSSIIYESPHRIAKLIDELLERCPERQMCIAREMTKLFEEYLRGSVKEIHEQLAARTALKGEMVVILQGRESDD